MIHKEPSKAKHKIEEEEELWTWLTYSANFMHTPKTDETSTENLIQSAFESTVKLAESIDAYFEE